MSKLTKRGLGLLSEYEVVGSKKEAIQKLGAIEHQAEALAERVCDNVCRFRDERRDGGSDPTAAGGGSKEGSEWQRSAKIKTGNSRRFCRAPQQVDMDSMESICLLCPMKELMDLIR